MRINLVIEGMTCLDCSRHVTRALERVEGVAGAWVDYRAGRATVQLADSGARTPEFERSLAAAVERAGYRATVSGADDGRPVAAAALVEAAHGGSGHSDTPSFAGEAPARPTSAGPGAGAAHFDVLIIGTGGAGMAAAIQAAGMGAKVAVAEGGLLGGTCVNVGCIPSKNLIEAAAHYHSARHGFPGIAPCEPALDWPGVIGGKDRLVEELRQAKYADVLASYPGVARLDGRAELLASGDGQPRGPLRVRVGDKEYSVRKVVIATGTSPAVPALPGLDQVEALDSTSAMVLERLPVSLIVVGGGPVGVELGQTFARFGVKVIIVQRGPRLLSDEDAAITEALRAALEGEGIEIHTNTAATRVERVGDEVVVHVRQESLDGELRAERLLIAAGRQPNTQGLGLGALGVALTPRGYVKVNATMRASNPDVYAAGDVAGGPAYVYVAAAGGRVAAENAIKSLAPIGSDGDEPRELDLSVVPSVTFTSPQVGSVGLTEAAARAAGHHVDVSVLDMGQVPRALVSHDRRGLVKMVAEAGSGRILGVHAVAANAGEFMGEATLAVRFGLTARDLSGTLHPYLTWVESVKLAAQGFAMDVSKLSCCA